MFYNAVAKATNIIAEFEDWLLDGKRLKLPSGLLTAPKMVLPSLLEHDGKVAIFLLNFDPRRVAEVQFNVSHPLIKGKKFMNAMTKRYVSLSESVHVPKLGVMILVGSKTVKGD